MKRLKRFTETSTVYFIGNVLSKMVNILLLPIITSIINPADYGNYDVVLTIISLIVPIAFVQIWDGIFRFSFDVSHNNKINVIYNGYIVTMFGFIVYSLLYFFVSIWYHDLRNLYILFYSLTVAIQYLFTVNARIYLNNSLFVVSGTINTIITAVLTLIFLLFFNLNTNGLFLANSIGILFQIIIIEFKLKTFKQMSHGKIDFKLITDMIKFSIPLCLSTLSYWGLNGFSRIVILVKVGEEGNGLFAIANKFSSIVLLFAGVFQFAWNEMIYVEANDKKRFLTYNKGVEVAFKITMLTTCLILIFIKIIYPYFIDERYWQSMHLIPPVIIGVAFNSYASLLGTVFLAEKKSSVMFYTALLSTIVNIFLALILSEHFQVLGVSISLAIAMILNSLMRYITLIKISNLKITIDYFYILFVMTLTVILYYNLNSITELIISLITILLISAFLLKDTFINIFRSFIQ